MQDNKRFFLVTGGAVADIIARFIARRAAQFEARQQEAKRWGATGTCGDARRIAGLSFEDTPEAKAKPVPEGWGLLKGFAKFYAPKASTKEGRPIHEAWRALPLDEAGQFQADVMGYHDPFCFMDGMTVRSMFYERMGDQMFLVVPKVRERQLNGEPLPGPVVYKWQPPDDGCRELRMSEYWKLREDFQNAHPEVKLE